jgi:predicted metal-dependent phosphotriesterase family hydrolase
METFIRTVLGDIPVENLGVTYMHEHLIIDSEIVKNKFSHIYLPSVKEASAEIAACKKIGVSSVVDCMPTGSGRSISKLAQISKATNINVIAVTGLHHARYYHSDDPLENMDAEELAQIFISEIEVGAEKTLHRTGVIKIVTSGKNYSARERRLFTAAAIAHRKTGAPILTHCEHGTGAIEQLALLQELKVPLSSVILSHTDKENDVGYHREILSSGVYVEYDQSLRQVNDDAAPSAILTLAMVGEGFGNQIMFGTDGARRSLWTTLGGSPGLAWLYSGWSKKLLQMGLEESVLAEIFIKNPRRALAFKIGQ